MLPFKFELINNLFERKGIKVYLSTTNFQLGYLHVVALRNLLFMYLRNKLYFWFIYVLILHCSWEDNQKHPTAIHTYFKIKVTNISKNLSVVISVLSKVPGLPLSQSFYRLN